MNNLEINNLNYNNLFQDLSIDIEKNCFITISGPNNCGKTTLLRILSNEIEIEDTIIINDKYLEDYKLEDYQSLIQIVIKKEYINQEKTLKEEIEYINCDESYKKSVIKELNIKSLLKKEWETMTNKEIVMSQLLISLLRQPKILLLDDIGYYLDKDEKEIVFNYLNKYKEKAIIINTTINLEDSLCTDYLYIINNGKIALEGNPIKVLQKDNVINKIGLKIPFMIDLSVKLRDYNLIEEIELDKDRMVELLWK